MAFWILSQECQFNLQQASALERSLQQIRESGRNRASIAFHFDLLAVSCGPPLLA